MERLITTEELCELWSAKKSWVYDEVQAGRLRHVRLGKRLRFRMSDLNEYLNRASHQA